MGTARLRFGGRGPTVAHAFAAALWIGVGLAALLWPGHAAGEAALPERPGGLTPVGGPGGCLMVSPGSSGCGPLPAVSGPLRIKFSPDERFAYVLGAGSHSIAVLARDGETGALTPVGCVADATSPFAADCAAARALRSPTDIAFSDRAYVAARGSDAVAVFDRDAATGMLRQPDGPAGCGQRTGSEGCAAASTLDGPVALATADRVVVVASANNSSVTGFDVGNGQLWQPPWSYSCVMEQGGGSTGCLDGRGLATPSRLVMRGDDVYVSSIGGDAIARLRRSGGGASFNEQAPGAAGCLSASGPPDCGLLNGLFDPDGLALVGPQLYVAARSDADPALGALSALDLASDGSLARAAGRCLARDGAFGCASGAWIGQPVDVTVSHGDIYVASSDDAVTAYHRETDASLAAMAGPTRCVAADPARGCATAAGLTDPQDIEATSDRRFLYVASAAGVVALRRDSALPSCSDGWAGIPAASTMTLPLTCRDPDGEPVRAELLRSALGGRLAIDQDNRSVTFSADPGFTGRTGFAFRPITVGAAGPPATFKLDIYPPRRVGARVEARFSRQANRTRVRRLTITGADASARVEIRCSTRARGCPFTKRLVKPRSGRADTTPLFRGRALAPGAVIEIQITKANFIGRTVRYRIQRHSAPRRGVLCLPPAGSTNAAC